MAQLDVDLLIPVARQESEEPSPPAGGVDVGMLALLALAALAIGGTVENR